MQNKIKKTPKSTCPNCNNKNICYYNNSWRFECDDGLAGFKINYCPFCGENLKNE